MIGPVIIPHKSRHAQAGRLDLIVPTPPSTALRATPIIAPAALVAPRAIPSMRPGATRQAPPRTGALDERSSWNNPHNGRELTRAFVQSGFNEVGEVGPPALLAVVRPTSQKPGLDDSGRSDGQAIRAHGGSVASDRGPSGGQARRSRPDG